jgi:hemolysin D
MNAHRPSAPAGAIAGPTSALTRLETQPPPQPARRVLQILCALLVVLFAWACLAKLDIVAVAEGRLVPKTYVKIVQPAEAGIVREILVREGDRVDEGQLLLRLDSTVAGADREAVQRELALQRLQLRRIEAELRGVRMQRELGDDSLLFSQVLSQQENHRQAYLDALAQEQAAGERVQQELEAARAVLEKYRQTLPAYERSAKAHRELAEKKLVGQLQADERQTAALEKAQELQAQLATVSALQAAVRQSEERRSQLTSGYRSDLNSSRMEAVGAIARLEQEDVKAGFRAAHLELRASQEGVVKDLATTTLGAVVQPGTVLLTLVPTQEPLRAEVMIQNKDIGFVQAGQHVRLKVAPYAFQKYGMIEGTVLNVSADSQSSTSADQQHQSGAPLVFKALVALNQQSLRVGSLSYAMTAGMQVSAEILQGRRTVAEYLLSPVQRVASEMAQER